MPQYLKNSTQQQAKKASRKEHSTNTDTEYLSSPSLLPPWYRNRYISTTTPLPWKQRWRKQMHEDTQDVSYQSSYWRWSEEEIMYHVRLLVRIRRGISQNHATRRLAQHTEIMQQQQTQAPTTHPPKSVPIPSAHSLRSAPSRWWEENEELRKKKWRFITETTVWNMEK